jgi:hypothetical protein
MQSRPRELAHETSRQPAWLVSVLLATAFAAAYFLAARLSLALLTKPMASPYSGRRRGSPRERSSALDPGCACRSPWALPPPGAAASLLSDRNLAAAAVFALCNGAEPLLVARLIGHQFGEDFRLETLRSVLGFYMAAAIGPALSVCCGGRRFHPVPQIRRPGL